jgi:hypothetical protein
MPLQLLFLLYYIGCLLYGIGLLDIAVNAKPQPVQASTQVQPAISENNPPE